MKNSVTNSPAPAGFSVPSVRMLDVDGQSLLYAVLDLPGNVQRSRQLTRHGTVPPGMPYREARSLARQLTAAAVPR